MTPQDEEVIEKVRTAIKLVQSVRVTEAETLSDLDDQSLGAAVRDIYASRPSEFRDLVESGQVKPDEVQMGLNSTRFENLDRAFQLLKEVKEDLSSLSTTSLNLDFRSAPSVIRNVYLEHADDR